MPVFRAATCSLATCSVQVQLAPWQIRRWELLPASLTPMVSWGGAQDCTQEPSAEALAWFSASGPHLGSPPQAYELESTLCHSAAVSDH